MHYKFSSRFPYVRKQRIYDLTNSISDELVQRVIIPQGLVNPSQTTIIEIPYNYQDIPTVIAKPKEDSTTNKCHSTRQTKIFPQASDDSARNSAATSSQYSTGSASSRIPVKTRTVIETTRYTEEIPIDDESTCTDLLDSKAKNFLKGDQLPTPSLQENSVVYEKLGRPLSPSRLEKNYKQPKRNFALNINDAPQSGEFNYLDTGRCAVMYGEPFKKQIPHYNLKLPPYSTQKEYIESPESNLNTTNYFTEGKSSASTYTKHHAKKKHFSFDNKSDPEEELKDVLDNLDLIEEARIQRELKQFQKARRKSIYDAASIKH